MLPPQVGIDQKSLGRGIASGAEHVPPAPYARNRERGGVVGDAEIDPSGVGGDIVDAVWRGLAEFRDEEVVHPNRFGLSFGAQFAATIFEVANKFFSSWCRPR